MHQFCLPHHHIHNGLQYEARHLQQDSQVTVNGPRHAEQSSSSGWVDAVAVGRHASMLKGESPYTSC